MASQQIVSELQEEVTCPICLDILQDPVTIECGHNFCLTCITQSKDASSGLLVCSLCKMSVNKDTLRPNRLLTNLAGKIQAMRPCEIKPEKEKLKCQKHQEKIHYFCEHDGMFLCTVCCQSKDHTSHKISLIEEAAPNYQGKIESQLKDLQQKETTIVQAKTQGEQKVKVFMDQVEYEKQRIIREFKNLHQVLKEEERFLSLRLSWLGQEGKKEGHLFSAFMQARLNSLNELVDSLKAKQQMSPNGLLWDIQAVLLRSQEFQCLHPAAISPDMEKKLGEVKLRHDSITETLKKFRDNFQADGKKDRSRNFRGMSEDMMKNWHLLENNSKLNKTSKPEPTSPGNQKTAPASPNPSRSAVFCHLFRAPSIWVATPSALLQARNRASFAGFPRSSASCENLSSTSSACGKELKVAPSPVILDAASAHPDLALSQDLKTVRLDILPSRVSEEPTDPARFYPFHCVLGSPGLSSGNRTWEVELCGPGGGGCVIGVASEHAARQGFLHLEPLAGYWALRIAGSECQALLDGSRLELGVRPRRVGVRVDHKQGEIVFYDASTRTDIYTFHGSFPGQIFPFFRLLFPGTQITLSP